ncbi:MAG: hypothetical protein PHQ12_01150 [Chthoniobacteraceae bacterium]|nr:hypothetical protein [Chthoniobacteraceae bacterium]
MNIYDKIFRVLRQDEFLEPGDVSMNGSVPREITYANCGFRVDRGYYLRPVLIATVAKRILDLVPSECAPDEQYQIPGALLNILRTALDGNLTISNASCGVDGDTHLM